MFEYALKSGDRYASAAFKFDGEFAKLSAYSGIYVFNAPFFDIHILCRTVEVTGKPILLTKFSIRLYITRKSARSKSPEQQSPHCSRCTPE